MTVLALLAVALLVAVNAVFVAVEFALLASSDVRLESDVEEGRHGAARALIARTDLRRQLSGAQLGITASSVALGVLAVLFWTAGLLSWSNGPAWNATTNAASECTVPSSATHD